MPEDGWVTATWARQCPADAFSFAITNILQADVARAMDVIAVARVGVEPTEHEGRSPPLRWSHSPLCQITYRAKQASSMGFEPTSPP